jgi:hypothetical protein
MVVKGISKQGKSRRKTIKTREYYVEKSNVQFPGEASVKFHPKVAQVIKVL